MHLLFASKLIHTHTSCLLIQNTLDFIFAFYSITHTWIYLNISVLSQCSFALSVEVCVLTTWGEVVKLTFIDLLKPICSLHISIYIMAIHTHAYAHTYFSTKVGAWYSWTLAWRVFGKFLNVASGRNMSKWNTCICIYWLLLQALAFKSNFNIQLKKNFFQLLLIY